MSEQLDRARWLMSLGRDSRRLTTWAHDDPTLYELFDETEKWSRSNVILGVAASLALDGLTVDEVTGAGG